MKITSPSYKEVSINNYRNLLKYTDKERSTALNLWEKFCDLFRSNKKRRYQHPLQSNHPSQE